MSIFQKDCPQCAASNTVRATRCKCGYFFEAAATNGKHATTEVALQEETLYQDYLAARLVQAEATVEVARGNAAADPANTYKAAQVLLAEQALGAARAELRAQTTRTTHLKKVSTRAQPVVAVTPPQARVTTATKVAPKKPVRAMPVVKRETVQLKVASAPVAKPAEIPVPPMHAAKPGAKFRKQQAAKAKALLHSVRSAQPSPPAVARTEREKKPVVKPAASKHVTVAATKDCPNCTATVAAQVERCRCGFSFSDPSVGMPSLSLDAETTPVLDNDTNFSRIPRRS